MRRAGSPGAGSMGLHSKPLVILNADGFYDPLLAFFRRAHGEGFIGPDDHSLYRLASTAGEAMEILGDGASDAAASSPSSVVRRAPAASRQPPAES